MVPCSSAERLRRFASSPRTTPALLALPCLPACPMCLPAVLVRSAPALFCLPTLVRDLLCCRPAKSLARSLLRPRRVLRCRFARLACDGRAGVTVLQPPPFARFPPTLPSTLLVRHHYGHHHHRHRLILTVSSPSSRPSTRARPSKPLTVVPAFSTSTLIRKSRDHLRVFCLARIPRLGLSRFTPRRPKQRMTPTGHSPFAPSFHTARESVKSAAGRRDHEVLDVSSLHEVR